MRRVIFVLSLLFALLPAVAQASFEAGKSWFDGLGEGERDAIQADLILLGHYGYPIDGQFGPATFEAITAFQRSQGSPATGALAPEEREALARLADAAQRQLGMRKVDDARAQVAMSIPANLLTRRMPTEQGTSYVSADGEMSLETMHTTLAEQSFSDLYAFMVAPDPERTVAYQSYGDTRFVVAGTIGAYSFYTMFVTAGGEAVGYSLAWGTPLAAQGAVSSVWIASHFTPFASLSPEERAAIDGDPGTDANAAFELPAGEPQVIALKGEIEDGAVDGFDRALATRPDATTLVLDSPGGSVEAALILAQEVRRRGLRTYVPEGMGCYSACAYVFLAGENRIVDGDLGVHQIALDGADAVSVQMMLGDVLDALDAFGVQQRVVSYMLRTPPDGMYVFSRPELGELGINRGQPIALMPEGQLDGIADDGDGQHAAGPQGDEPDKARGQLRHQ